MSIRSIAFIIVILAFGALTALALMDVGYIGIFEAHLQSWGGMQVLIDLVIACLLACVWMASDAPKSGMTAWPFIVLTLVGGSFGPLAYLLVREWRGAKATV
ncbi:MAG: DUF2834 domain-containing protein [Parvibaculaceae bacterium]